ncbi:MAG: hypothetical protein AB8G11_25700 [Saprospiraceae bacterium]
MKHILFSLLLVMVSLTTFAQVQKPSSDMSYRKKITMADEFMQKGDYGSAAAFYLSAFEEKPKKIEIAEKAGNAFVKIRDYKNAASMFKVLKEDSKTYPKAPYHYSLAIKQSGDYKNAMIELEAFINNYRAEDFNEMNDNVANAIKGCELAIQTMSSNKKPDIEIEYLSRMVNSDANEFAPIPFVENLLYFSSMRDGTAQIFRSERGGSGWDKPEKPQIFGSMERPHFGHGAFTPDRRAFYFTQCDMNMAGEFSCDIYIMQRMNNKWAKPIRLPDYINEENTTSTMPFVTVIDDKEILYFVSDREGGMGGTDIWYVTKEGSSTDFNFSLPINAGMGINTTGNEISPFYDKRSETMYFSSDGHPGFGGLDVFRSNGGLNTWDKPTNLGKPTNSGADDKYYVLGSSKNKEYGYFISNRLEGTEKEYTDNDDIFYFEMKEVEVVIRGSIAELGNENKLLDNVTVDLIIIEETGDENRLATKVFNDGEYYFKLSPNREYKIEATKDGYETTFFELETNAFTGNSEFVQDLTLEKVEVVAVIETPPTKPKEIPATDEPPTKPNLSEIAGSTDFVENTEEKPQKPEIIPATPEQPEMKPEVVTEVMPEVAEPQIDSDIRYNADGEKLISFEELTKEEKRDRVFFVDDMPYIRRNGELFAVEGLVEDNVATTNNPQTPPGRPTTVITEPKPIKDDGLLPEGTLEIETGEYYKIQLVAVTTYKPYKYESLNNLGAIQLESTVNSSGSEIQRVMLTPFQTLDEAKTTLSRIVENPRFQRAFIVKYVDGQRVKHSKIRLSSFRG